MWFFSSCIILPRLILKWIYFPKAHIGWVVEGHALCYLAGINRLGLTSFMVSSGLKDAICNKTCLFRWILYSFNNTEHDPGRGICHLTLFITLGKISWLGSYQEKNINLCISFHIFSRISSSSLLLNINIYKIMFINRKITYLHSVASGI